MDLVAIQQALFDGACGQKIVLGKWYVYIHFLTLHLNN
jgi:hypothetical protein